VLALEDSTAVLEDSTVELKDEVPALLDDTFGTAPWSSAWRRSRSTHPEPWIGPYTRKARTAGLFHGRSWIRTRDLFLIREAL
jgi:hypothetical protein